MRWVLYILGSFLCVAGALVAVGIYISPQDELQESELIVAVSGGDTQARTMEAVQLYQDGWAPRLLFSGAALDPSSPSNAAAMRQLAIEAGVPPDAIIIEEGSGNTRENASRSALVIAAFERQRIILVTSPYHQRRTYIEFRSQLGDEVEIINHPAPDQQWSRSRWWRTPFGWWITASELPKIIYALTQS